ncbi:MAG TPA: MarR family transcriptional regulator [Acidimicrobiia bacterium]|nr:MarR family transcriptional regulator [Acidimicrobiia bacterium]
MAAFRGSGSGHHHDAEAFDDLARRRVAELAPGTDLDAMTVVFNVIRLANRMVWDLEASVHRRRGWSWAGFRILFTLWVAGPLEPRALARLSAVTRASISSVLNTLERDGLVRRRRESADRRIVTVDLTATGKAQVASAFREHNDRERDWTARITRAERRELAALLHRLLEGPTAATEGDDKISN